MVLLFAGRDNNTAHPPGQYLFLLIDKLQEMFGFVATGHPYPFLTAATDDEAVTGE